MSVGTIPDDIRVPLVYIDIDNSGAVSGTPAQQHKILVLGEQLGGDAVPLSITPITGGDSSIDALYGKGSMMSVMLKALKKNNDYTECHALSLPGITSGSQASAPLTLTGNAAEAGVISLMICGEVVQVAVEASATPVVMAADTVDAINDHPAGLMVTAEVDGSDDNKVILKSKAKGLWGNSLDVRVNYYDGERLPTGVAIEVEPFSGGAGTPDISEAISVLPDEWYNHIVMPYTDTASLNALRDELMERWGPLKMQEAIAYSAYRGNHAETGSFGATRNDFLVTCLGTNIAPQPPFVWAASYAGQAAYHLAIDPARPLQTLVMTGVLPPAKDTAWTLTERNLLLHDGIATTLVTPGNEVAIEREISMYQKSTFGDPDPSYLDITTPASLGYIRYAIKNMVTNRFPRHKLAGDDVLDRIDPGQPVVTPDVMTKAILELADGWVGMGLIEDYDLFAETLDVYRSESDKNRLNCVLKPDLVNQFRVFAALIQFKL